MPVPTATDNSYHFFVPLMDDKNLIIQAQMEGALFSFCKYLIVFNHCLISIVDIYPCLVLFTQSFVNEIKSFYSMLIPFNPAL